MSGVVVLAGDLVGVLAGLVPHLASVPRDPDGGPGGAGLGEGVARLVLVDEVCLLGLAVGQDGALHPDVARILGVTTGGGDQ